MALHLSVQYCTLLDIYFWGKMGVAEGKLQSSKGAKSLPPVTRSGAEVGSISRLEQAGSLRGYDSITVNACNRII